MWISNLDLTKCSLLPAVLETTVFEVQRTLICSFPQDYIEFLQSVGGGGYLHDKRFILFALDRSSGFPENIVEANRAGSLEETFISIGRDANDDFGFRRQAGGALENSIYFQWSETGELTYAAKSFRSFIEGVTSLSPGEAFNCEKQ